MMTSVPQSSTRGSWYKYWVVAKLAWQNGFVYRASLVLWRMRQFLSTLMSLTIWSVVFAGGQATFGYDQSEMITYIFLVSILQSVILATVTHDLARRVYAGEISYELVKPVNFYVYTAAIDFADKCKNLVFVTIEASILFLLFTPALSWPDLSTLVLFSGWVAGGLSLYYFVSLLFGALGFWSPETWGPKFLFFMMLDFVAGRLFPLDILPEVIQRLVFLTPFPYLSFLQIQLFLERLSTSEILLHSLGLLLWNAALGAVTLSVWQRGLKNYTAAGQ